MEKHLEADHQEHMPATGETDDNMTAGRYIATRISTLKPPMTKVANPISLLRMLNKQQWLFFSVAFIAWTWDGMSRSFFLLHLWIHADSFKRSTSSPSH